MLLLFNGDKVGTNLFAEVLKSTAGTRAETTALQKWGQCIIHEINFRGERKLKQQNTHTEFSISAFAEQKEERKKKKRKKHPPRGLLKFHLNDSSDNSLEVSPEAENYMELSLKSSRRQQFSNNHHNAVK